MPNDNNNAHPSKYELPYHDAVVKLREARRLLALARALADEQSDADAAFEWSLVFGEMLSHVKQAVALSDANGDPVVTAAMESPVRKPRERTTD